ncbi:MAG: hypothetical protein CMF35_15210 [Leeuwenhoekiella sp.]|nr:hypothetical protein [Leeuwenhoekiella sp.]
MVRILIWALDLLLSVNGINNDTEALHQCERNSLNVPTQTTALIFKDCDTFKAGMNLGVRIFEYQQL